MKNKDWDIDMQKQLLTQLLSMYVFINSFFPINIVFLIIKI